MTCDELAAQLTEFLEGALTDDVAAAALEHLATCASCERVLGETRQVMSLGSHHGRVRLDDGERSALLGRIVDAASPDGPDTEEAPD